MDKYNTIQGDMWDSISKKLYGSEKYVKELIEANTSFISILIFSTGVVLNVPAVIIQEETNNIPPWRR